MMALNAIINAVWVIVSLSSLHGIVMGTVYDQAIENLHHLERECPCSNPTLCLPIALACDDENRNREEIFAFSVDTGDQWKYYDWEAVKNAKLHHKVTTRI